MTLLLRTSRCLHRSGGLPTGSHHQILQNGLLGDRREAQPGSTKTTFMPALASAVRMFDLDAIGILDMDPAEWQRIGSGDAAAIESLAAREAKKARHG